VQRAVDAYHELLADDELAAASAAQLQDGQHEANLYFGEHPLSISLRPRLISSEQWDYAVAAAESIAGALGTLETALLTDGDLRRELDLEAAEERLALAHPGCRSSSPSARLDSFFADEVRYVEYNAESPAGMAYGDALADVMDAMPVMQRFRRRWKLRSLPTRASQLDCMLQAFREWGGAVRPSVAIVDWKGVPTVPEFQMFQEYFVGRDVPCVIAEPASLTYDGKHLRGEDGTVISVVYRRVLTSELLATSGGSDPLCQAYLDGTVVVINTFRAKLLHKKMSFALLSDDRYASLFTASQLAAIDRHIPWTRRLREGRSTRRGEEVTDLVAHVIEHRDKLVLKPNDEYGGKGVVLGWTVDDHDWEQVLRMALHETYVVQEAVPVPREQWPLAVGGSIEMVDMAVDMDPYLFGGQVKGVLIRLASSALLNVTAGTGSVVPTFVVDGELGDTAS
jgi:uncharacterized circularly permuted ATP-grasp superfamily protein